MLFLSLFGIWLVIDTAFMIFAEMVQWVGWPLNCPSRKVLSPWEGSSAIPEAVLAFAEKNTMGAWRGCGGER